MNTATNQSLTVKEVAFMLAVDSKTVYRLAQRADLPGFKVAGAWRFLRTDIDHWIATQKSAQRNARGGKQ
ncbi:MAG: helix-turn-helix domain-containing protein [Terracidiphilus sp.]